MNDHAPPSPDAARSAGAPAPTGSAAAGTSAATAGTSAATAGTSSATAGTSTATEPVDRDAPVPPGRPVRLVPTPPGLWRVLLGAVVALLAPFFGILIGSGIGSTDDGSRMDPLYWGFFIGGLIGALGLVAAGLGAMALIRHARAQNRAEDDEAH